MVTATTCGFTLLVPGGTKAPTGYISDVVNAKVLLSLTSLATTTDDNFLVFPYDVVLNDVAIKTGPTVIGGFQLLLNNVPTGNFFSLNTYLDSNNRRPAVSIPIKAGTKIQFQQG